MKITTQSKNHNIVQKSNRQTVKLQLFFAKTKLFIYIAYDGRTLVKCTILNGYIQADERTFYTTYIITYKVIQTDLQYNAQYSGNSNVQSNTN